MKKKKTKNKKNKSLPVLLTALLIIFGVAVTAVSSLAVSKNMEISSIKRSIDIMEEENRDLETAVNRLQSLQSLNQPESYKNVLIPVEKLRHIMFPGNAGNSLGSK